MRTPEVVVFSAIFTMACVVGVAARHWRSADLKRLDEWALGGRGFGTVVTWFLQGGSLYTTYAFVAVPGLVFGAGALGFFALPYTVVAFCLAYVVMPPLWRLGRERGYVTAADFVQDRFASTPLTVLVAATGVVATMPYVALQVYGIEVSIAQLGIPVQLSLFIAFAVLAGITYANGLRSAALIAVAKDLVIWTTVLVALIYIPHKLGGYGAVFHRVPSAKLNLPAHQALEYATLALGSGLALFLYPHTITGTLSAASVGAVKRSSIVLPFYSVMLGGLALLGYMAVAAGIHPSPAYGNNVAVPALFDHEFPAGLAGVALAAICIGGLVPAAVMAIAAANLFSRNLYPALAGRRLTEEQETSVSKLGSLSVKLGAVVFLLLLPATDLANFQLAGGVWILQTLPAVFLGLFLPWLDRRATITGWLTGMAWGTWLLLQAGFTSSTHSFHLFGRREDVYIGLAALVPNLIVALAGTALLRLGQRPGETLGGSPLWRWGRSAEHAIANRSTRRRQCDRSSTAPAQRAGAR